MNISNKAAPFRQLTFSWIMLFLFAVTGCEDPGSAGSQFVSKSELMVDTVLVDNLIENELDPFLGRLQRAASGQYEDDLYGSIKAVSYFKPDISGEGDTVQVGDNSLLRLRLRIYADDVYGDTTGTMEYHIYRATEQWRGTTIRKSSQISYNESELIGRFADTEIDTNGIITVILSGSYKDDFVNYLNADDEEIEEQYLREEFGLVVVPAGTRQRINYLNFISTDLLVQLADQPDFSVPILDWAFNFEQTDPAYSGDRIYPSNVDRYYQLDLSPVAERVRSENLIRAEFILYEDTLTVQNSIAPTETRTDGFELAMIAGPEPDPDFAIGFQPVDLNGFQLTNGTYVFNITTALNNYLFADADISELYLFLNSQQGLISFSTFFNDSTNSEFQPKVLLYNLRTDE
jgi:hypothetical protein